MRWVFAVLLALSTVALAQGLTGLTEMNVVVFPDVANTMYTYNFVFSDASNCNPLLNLSVDITTNPAGRGNATLDLTGLTTIPSYLCTYRNGTLANKQSLNRNAFEQGNVTTGDLQSVGNWSTDKPNYATNTFVTGVATNLTSVGNFSLHYNDFGNFTAHYLDFGNFTAHYSDFGNWTADKPNYLTTSHYNDFGNYSAERSLIYANFTSIGNWSADKPNYLASSHYGDFGNYSAERSLIYNNLTSIGNFTAHYLDFGNYSAERSLIYANFTSIGNWSADKPNYATNTFVAGVATNLTSVGNFTAHYLDFGNFTAHYGDFGNYSAERSLIYSNFTSIGNFSAHYTDFGNFTAHYLDFGNYSAERTTVYGNITSLNITKADLAGAVFTGDIQVVNLNATGNANITGNLAVSNNITVGGNLFNGIGYPIADGGIDYFNPYTLEFTNCNANVVNPFLGATTGAGTFVAQAGQARHPGICRISDSGTANANYRVMNDVNSFLINGTERGRFIFREISNRTTASCRFGFQDSAAIQTLPTDGVFFNFTATMLTGSARTGGVATTTATNYGMALNTWYNAIFTIDSTASTVTFELYDENETTLLWSDTVASNIPIAAGRETGYGVICGETSVDAGQGIADLDFMNLQIQRQIRQ